MKTILGISGSLRAGSFNTACLKAIEAHLSDSARLVYADIAAIPHYNGDVEAAGDPTAVTRFKQQIAQADAIVIATPEYNYSIPGVLKNAIDWASRPAYKSGFVGKPVGIVSASMAGTGGVRAQGHLKTILGGVLAHVLPMPDVQVAAAHRVVDDGGIITDQTTLNYLHRLGDAVLAAAW